jgi:hypothetical protein
MIVYVTDMQLNMYKMDVCHKNNDLNIGYVCNIYFLILKLNLPN